MVRLAVSDCELYRCFVPLKTLNRDTDGWNFNLRCRFYVLHCLCVFFSFSFSFSILKCSFFVAVVIYFYLVIVSPSHMRRWKMIVNYVRNQRKEFTCTICLHLSNLNYLNTMTGLDIFNAIIEIDAVSVNPWRMCIGFSEMYIACCSIWFLLPAAATKQTFNFRRSCFENGYSFSTKTYKQCLKCFSFDRKPSLVCFIAYKLHWFVLVLC